MLILSIGEDFRPIALALFFLAFVTDKCAEDAASIDQVSSGFARTAWAEFHFDGSSERTTLSRVVLAKEPSFPGSKQPLLVADHFSRMLNVRLQLIDPDPPFRPSPT